MSLRMLLSLSGFLLLQTLDDSHIRHAAPHPINDEDGPEDCPEPTYPSRRLRGSPVDKVKNRDDRRGLADDGRGFHGHTG